MSDEDDSEVESVIPEVRRDEYDLLTGLNFSRLKLLKKSPAHFKAGYGDDSASLKLGIAVHMAILEPARFAEEYIVTKLRRDKRTKVWKDFESEAIRAGKQVMIQSEYDRTIAVRDAVLANGKAVKYLSGGKPEVTIQWTIQGGDLRFDCKGRADYIGGAIVDLKSTQCSSPKAFGYSVIKYDYLMQAAWYVDGCRMATGEDRPFVFIAVESNPPHLVTVFTVSEQQLERGRDQYMTLLGKLDYCTKRNWWGGYTEEEEVTLELPNEWSEE
jgi:hypothetical protein